MNSKMYNLYEVNDALPLEKAEKTLIMLKDIIRGYKAMMNSVMSDQVKTLFQTFETYVSAVLAYVTEGEDAKGFGVEHYQSVMADVDRARTAKHNNMIAACASLNEIAEKVGIHPFCPDKGHDRKVYGDFAMLAVYALFMDGTGRDPMGMEELIRNMQKNAD